MIGKSRTVHVDLVRPDPVLTRDVSLEGCHISLTHRPETRGIVQRRLLYYIAIIALNTVTYRCHDDRWGP